MISVRNRDSGFVNGSQQTGLDQAQTGCVHGLKQILLSHLDPGPGLDHSIDFAKIRQLGSDGRFGEDGNIFACEKFD